MSRRKGFTILEMMVGLTLMVMALIGIVSMFIGGLRSFEKNSARVQLSEKNAQGLRWVSETLANAMNVTVSADGRTLTYNLPRKTVGPDPVTGEREYVDPLTPDGVARTFVVANGLMTDGTARTFVKRITATDPDPTSGSYNQTYRPFTLTQTGSSRVLTINLITLQKVNGKDQFARMKTTVFLHNAK